MNLLTDITVCEPRINPIVTILPHSSLGDWFWIHHSSVNLIKYRWPRLYQIPGKTRSCSLSSFLLLKIVITVWEGWCPKYFGQGPMTSLKPNPKYFAIVNDWIGAMFHTGAKRKYSLSPTIGVLVIHKHFNFSDLFWYQNSALSNSFTNVNIFVCKCYNPQVPYMSVSPCKLIASMLQHPFYNLDSTVLKTSFTFALTNLLKFLH